MHAPLIVEFVAGSSAYREADRLSDLPIHRNGPPGTFVRIGSFRVSLPTDQIVSLTDRDGAVTVGFGGMRFSGLEHGHLTFIREREVWPVERLSPARSFTMTLEPQWVAVVYQDGNEVWRA